MFHDVPLNCPPNCLPKPQKRIKLGIILAICVAKSNNNVL